MFIEFFLLVAVLKAGIALLVPNLRETIDPFVARKQDGTRLREEIQRCPTPQLYVPPIEAMSQDLLDMEPD